MSPVSPFHTRRCRITWTSVGSEGVFGDALKADRQLALVFGLELDPALVSARTVGYMAVNHRLIPVPEGLPRSSSIEGMLQKLWRQSDVYESGLGAPLPLDPPAAGSWYSFKIWARADELTRGQIGWFIYQPRLYIQFWVLDGVEVAGISYEFAYAEVPHYIILT